MVGKDMSWRALVSTVTVAFLLSFIGGAFYGMFNSAYESASSRSYKAGLESAGLPDGPRSTSAAHEYVAVTSERVSFQYALGYVLSLASIFVAVILLLAYAFGIRNLSTITTLNIGLISIGVAFFFICAAETTMGSPVQNSIIAGLILWVGGAVCFSLLLAIVWGLKRVFRSEDAT